MSRRLRSLRLAAAVVAALALPLVIHADDAKPAPSQTPAKPAQATPPPTTAPVKAPPPIVPKAPGAKPTDPPLPPVPASADPAVAQYFTRLRTPAESMATIQLPPGYHLQLVASEPDIISPVCMAWDANGAMYVAEMRTYMLDVNGKGTNQPKSRVSRLESTKGDGVYDKCTVFADNLFLPRQLLPLDDRVLIRETDTKDVFAYRDANGDGVSDERAEFYKGGKVGGNLEHQSSHLTWNIDNWMYQTVDNTRFRFTRGKLEVAPLPFKCGQWGYGTTDDGRMIFATAGAERPAHNFQVPLPYGNVNLAGELAPEFTEVYGLVKLTDYQGGVPRVAPEGGLNRFTGCAGPCIFRGDALPKDLYGDYILPEPVGRIVRRAKVTDDHGKIVLKNAYEKQEFLASTDANFRPVFSATGPDGCLYLLDMYHGIIQESNWTQQGSYLRKEILRYGLDQHINAGRIYRLVHDDYKPHFERPHMLDETPDQLVAHLSHPNGWWRDTAQRLIVLKGDKSVVPALQQLAAGDANPVTRLHALWTLEGLDSADPTFVVAQLKDADPRVRSAAIRILEPLIRKDDATVVNAIKPLATDPDAGVVKQYCLSLLYTEHPQAEALIKVALDPARKNPNVESVVKGYKVADTAVRAEKLRPRHLDGRYAVSYMKGRDMYAQTCIACHGPDGKGTPAPEGDGLTLAPPLQGSKRLLADKSVPINLVLHGLTGPHEGGKMYPNEMAGFPWADDNLVADVLTYARNTFDNKGGPVDPKDVAAARKASASRTTPYSLPEINEVIAKLMPPPDKAKAKEPTKPEKPAAPAPAPK